MRKIMYNSIIPLIVGLFFVIGCGTFQSIGDPNAPKVERGRLKFAKRVTALNIGREPVSRDVRQNLYVNGKEWSPEGDKNFADKLNWCDTSPNPKVEILRCFGDATEGYKTTYILRMKDDKPDLQKFDEGTGSVWIDDDGGWLLFKKLFYNVETGEKIEIKGMPFADDETSSAPVQYVVAISPDKKTVVAMPDNSPDKEGAEAFLTLWIVNIETGETEKRKVSFTKNPWLKDYKNPDKDIQPPPEPSKHFVWEKGADGRDKISVPQLLEKIEAKKANK